MCEQIPSQPLGPNSVLKQGPVLFHESPFGIKIVPNVGDADFRAHANLFRRRIISHKMEPRGQAFKCRHANRLPRSITGHSLGNIGGAGIRADRGTL